MSTTVTNQQELNAAIEAGEEHIIINSPHGVWLDVSTPPTTEVELWGSSTATLRGSSTATLRGSSTATLWGSSTATLWESSTATLRGSSTA
ncbi:hypothetical protein KIH74_25430, partial [Kineosporia sp. J2-2]